ncbi:KpsF/GutQ family sugar-phosphate isomerase [Biostraticola tofi]|uniref:arabinose-5-phosphate isomerase n=1 Tax=Biostraticola tofi TaxID=466109 RepID=A0A4R3Z360_9GAMM|nr:SIS domain-containing protein [Biostraticola tofi]TCV98334.1 KpsF/GutQ family protein [Biostraticola tofi]
MDKNEILRIGCRVLNREAHALQQISATLAQDGFYEAVRLLHNTLGHIVISGVGKSGHIGRKISSCLSSTGSPSYFLHPTEAQHGDLGMLAENDTVLLISYSGKTREILEFLPYLQQRRLPIVSLTGDQSSPLAKAADVSLGFVIEREACSFDIVPTVSTCATLALGDALTIALMELNGFTSSDFYSNHPSGNLGKVLADTLDNDLFEN